MRYLQELEPRILLSTTLAIESISWNVLGLDSNDVDAGPNSYLIGARVTNTGAEEATGVTVTFTFDEADATYISLSSDDTRLLASLGVGESHDFYFNVDVTRLDAAYDQTRDYHISAIADNASEVTTPLGYEFYVEHLVSQNRNYTLGVVAPTTVMLGSIFTITHYGKTATNGYEQLVSELTLPSDVFEILSTEVTYSAPPGATNDQLYVDAALWDNDPSSPTYLSVLGVGKAGGTTTTTYTVRIVDSPASLGSYFVTANIYDFSGSSFHYNSDYGSVGITITVISATGPAFGDTVFEDLNANGVQDSGEPGIGGVTVSLRRASDDAVISSVVTPASGFFLFDQVSVAGGFPVGDYYLSFVAPAGYVYTGVGVGGDANLDSNANPTLDGDGNPLTARTTVFAIGPAEVNLSVDAGLYRPATVSGFVWNDLDADGTQDGGSENGASATVNLYDSTGTLVATQVTPGSGGSRGLYSFSGLTPGTYTVEVILPAGTGFSPQNAAADGVDSDVSPANGRTDPFTVLSNAVVDFDAGLVSGRRLGDLVWLDLNANGIQDPGEPGMDGITVELLNTSNVVLASTVTAGGGFFTLGPVASGTYALRFTAPSGYTFTSPLQGGDARYDSNVDFALVDGDANAQTARTPYVVIASLDYTLDCGLVGIGTIGNFVWDDLDGDGVQDGGAETGLDGITIRLYREDVDGEFNGNEVLVGSTVSAGGGAYLFANLPPGSYWVEVDESSAPVGASLTTGANPVGLVVLGTGALPGSMSNLTADFGFSRPIVNATKTVALQDDADSSGGITPGDVLRYTVVITNTGGVDALSVSFSDLVGDPNLSLVVGTVTTSLGTVTTGNTAGDTTVVVSVGTMGPGGSVTITLDLLIADPVLPAGTYEVSNQGTVTGDNFAPEPTDDPGTGADNDATVTDLPTPPAPDLVLTVSDGVGSTTPGATLSYVLDYSNVGSVGATGVVLTETLPPDTVFNAGASTPGWVDQGGGVFTFDLGSLPAGASGSVTFAVTVAGSMPPGVGTLTNSASIADDGTNGVDPNPGDNSGSDTDTLDAAPDLQIDITDGVTSAGAGDSLTYTITTTNVGDQTGTGVTLVVNFDPSLLESVVAMDGGVVDAVAGTITWDLGSLAGGGSSTAVTFTASVVSPLPAGATLLVVDGTVDDDGANGADPTPVDNSGSDVDSLTGAPDYAVTVDDGVASVAPGDGLTWTVTVDNVGTRGGTGVTAVAYFDPALLTNVVAQNGGVVDLVAGTITWDLGALGAGGSTAVTFTADVADPVPAGAGSLVIDASVGDDGTQGPDPTPANNAASDSDTLNAAPDYMLTLSDGVTTVAPGDGLTYTVTVTNAGQQGGTGVTVTATFDSSLLTGVVAQNGGVVDAGAGTITWDLGGLAGGGASTVVTFTATVVNPVPAGTVLLSTAASVDDDGANGADPTPLNNAASDDDTLDAAPDYRVRISDGLDSISAGQTVTYVIQVDNVGNQDGTGVVLTGSLPAGFTGVVASDGGVVDAAAGTVTWSLGGLAAGGSRTVTLTGTFASRIPLGVASVTCAVSVTDDGANGADPTPGDDTASDVDGVGMRRTRVVPDDAFGSRRNRLPGLGVFRHRLMPLPDLAPVYSGTADPDSVLELALQNSRGEVIGWQSVQADAGGNWVATFAVDALTEYRYPGADFLPADPRAPQPSQDGDVFDESRLFVESPGAARRVGTCLNDGPHEIAIAQGRPAVDSTAAAGLNLRVYFAPAFHGGLYDFAFTGSEGARAGGGLEALTHANAQPLRMGFVSFAGEFLCASWVTAGR